ncbi:MAG: ABC transporter substrate-binding protein, partial [Sulfitobacter sp.]
MKFTNLALAAGLAIASIGAAHAQQGVTDDEVVIGTNGDLSGPFAPFVVQAVQTIQWRIDEVNEAGGIHGRKIRYVVEDHGYQVPRAMANFNKLINSDQVFA